MFNSARIKLTAWYLLIITLISVSFSVVTYRVLTMELDRVERLQRFRIERRLFIPPPVFSENDRFIDPSLIKEIKDRLIMILFLINCGIISASALAGYFLAGRTLGPIKEMVDEQNRFISDASHELRTPLTSLKSEIEVNLRDKDLTIIEARKLLESNLDEVNNMQNLSDKLIKITQFERRNSRLNFSSLSICEIVKEAVRRISGLARNKQIKIDNNIKEYSIYGDKDSLIELFVIFLDNAVKYSHQKTKITLSNKKTDGYVLIEIADQGIGIDKQDLPHLFNRFYRADKSRAKTDISGYGLGLSIAKQIIEEHNGSIKIVSKVNFGTTFILLLPAGS